MLFGVAVIMSHASNLVGSAIRGGARAGAAAVGMVGIPIAPDLIRGAGEAVGDVVDVAAMEISEALTAAGRMAKLGLVAIAVSRPVELNRQRRSELAAELRKLVLTLRRSGHQHSADEVGPA
jgi:hypothetical protein